MSKIKNSPYLTVMRREARIREKMAKELKRGQNVFFERNGDRSSGTEKGFFVEEIGVGNIKVVNERGMLESIPKAWICEERNGTSDTENEQRRNATQDGNQTGP